LETEYIDVHAHMNEGIFDKDRKQILDECSKKGIVVVDCAGTPENNRKLVELIKKFKNLKACLGIYPIQTSEMTDKVFFEELKFIEENADKIIGIGEVGLDFYWIKEEEKRKLQIDRFKEIIWLANKLKLPLNVHTRDAVKESLALLINSAHVPVILHAYGGDIQDAKAAVERGLFFSVPTNIVYNKKRQELIAALPIANLLTETDCPYLGPTPAKDRNDPRNIPLALEKIAEIKKIDIEETRKILLENARKVFSNHV
jgi:TatD DNase family protein